MNTQQTMRMTAARKAVALLCLALFFALQVLAISPALHRALHSDADQADHQCAVTALTQGQLDAPSTSQTPIVSPAYIAFRLPPPVESGHTSFDYRLLPGRGPPASLLG